MAEGKEGTWDSVLVVATEKALREFSFPLFLNKYYCSLSNESFYSFILLPIYILHDTVKENAAPIKNFLIFTYLAYIRLDKFSH